MAKIRVCSGYCGSCVHGNTDLDDYPCNECNDSFDVLKTDDPIHYVPDTLHRQSKLPGAKSDDGKVKPHEVPKEIIWAIAKVRQYGNAKYADPENWKRVDPEKFHDALLRHVLAMWNDPYSIDSESHLPHLWHLVTNAAFLCYFLNEEMKDEPT